MFGFFRKNEPYYKAIKLYSIGADSSSINRANLLDTILEVCKESFGSVPKEYDIFGPYGISKGSSIGIKSFRNKLKTKGHEKYKALHGETPGKYGFDLNLSFPLKDLTYSELIIWYKKDNYKINFIDVVKPILTPFNATSGFEIELPENHHIEGEKKIKKGLLGGTSITVSYEHLLWLHNIKNGKVRDIYKNNILNKEQYIYLKSISLCEPIPLDNELYFLNLNEEHYLDEKHKYWQKENA